MFSFVARKYAQVRRFIRRTILAKSLHQERCIRRLNAALSRKIRRGAEKDALRTRQTSSNFGE